MKKPIGVLVIIIMGVLIPLILSTVVIADEIVTTKDGKKVLLKDNGTWEYVKEEPKNQESLSKYDFRDTNWGMSKEQIKKIEKAKFYKEENDRLAYEGNIGGMNCLIVYMFTQNKLVRARYITTEKHTNTNDFISDLGTLKDLLTKKYGNPTEDDTIWKKDLYKDDPQHWGMAVSVGHLSYFVTWETPTTKIIEYLYGDNFDINLGIEYSSKQLKSLEDKAKEEAEKQKL